MQCNYKTNEILLNFPKYSRILDIQKDNYGIIDNSIKKNTLEIDFAILYTLIPDSVKNICNNKNIKENIANIAKFSASSDIIHSTEIYSFAFFDSLKNIIINNDDYALDIIMIVKNLWKFTQNYYDTLFDDEFITIFCKYLFSPFDIRNYAFEAFDFLLRKHPEKLKILLENNIIKSLEEIFMLDEYQLNEEILERPSYFLITLVIKSSLENNILRKLIVICLKYIKYTYIIPKLCSSVVLYHIVCEMNNVNVFTSIDSSTQDLIQAHYFSISLFKFILPIDTILIYSGFEKFYLDKKMNNGFFDNLINILLDSKYQNYYEFIYTFFITTMPKIWEFLYLYRKQFINQDISLIEILLNQSINENVNNRVLSGACISSFFLEASSEAKQFIISQGGFDSICDLIPTANFIYLKIMLKSLFLLFSIDESYLNDLNHYEIFNYLQNLDIQDEEISNICNSLLHFIQKVI